MKRTQYTAKASWVELGGQRFYARSVAEKNHAASLEMLRACGSIREWKHEPETFYFPDVKRGSVSYKPDFAVVGLDGRTTYHEVKGRWDRKSVEKIRLMARHHPEVRIETFGAWLSPKDRERIEAARAVGRREAAKAARRCA